MKIGLFMPCYIDLVYPKVGIATLQLLEKFGLDVDYPLNQTCCGQPMSNSGDQHNARGAEQLFVDIFKGYDCIIGPAGSCVKQVRCHYDTLDQTDDVMHVREHTYELVEFLHDILNVESFPWAEFPHSVAIHNSCSSVRGLGLARPSEIMRPPFNKTEALLSKVKGLVLQEFPQIFGASQPNSNANCRLGGAGSDGPGLVWERIFLMPSARA
jgi:L-lactate dehydrogenase complex protein LldE